MGIVCKLFNIKGFIIIFVSLLLMACSEETNTSQIIAMEEIKQDANVDLFILDASVYKKTRDLKNEDVAISDYTKIGEIEKAYKDGETFSENMATSLPIGTEIYKQGEDSHIVVAETSNGYILYESIPEG